MALGAGIDIIAISRMQGVLDNSGRDAFLRRVYTPGEIVNFEQHPEPVAFLAKTFAAKEAIFKCFGIAGGPEVRLTDIEIHDGEFGEPHAVLSGYFAELAAQRGADQVHLSISYDGDYAVAVAILTQ